MGSTWKKKGGGHSLKQYEAWKRAVESENEIVASAVVAMNVPPRSSAEFVLILGTNAINIGLARKLTEKSHALRCRDPLKALALARLASEVAAKAPAPAEFPFAGWDAEGFAWMRRASALLQLGRYQEALDAALNARYMFFMASPYTLRSSATLDLIQGQIRHGLGETDAGLELIEHAANIIRDVFGETDKYVEAMTMYGGILMRADRYDEAAQVWEDIAALASGQGDTATLAYMLNNFGLCNLHVRKIDEAKRCFSTALKMFQELGLNTEIPRVRGGFALALTQEGRYAQAISEHYLNRAEFVRYGMLVDAGKAATRIIETLFIAGRFDDIPRLCEETVQFFKEAGLPHEARKAAVYMEDAARRGKLHIDDVREVEAFIERLRDSPTDSFVPPSDMY